MTGNFHFRSQFNGLNREDVVSYIEYLNNKHATEVSQLKSEIERLKSKLNTSVLPSDLESAEQRSDALVARVAELELQLAEKTAEAEQLKQAEPTPAEPVVIVDDSALRLQQERNADLEAKCASLDAEKAVLELRVRELEAKNAEQAAKNTDLAAQLQQAQEASRKAAKDMGADRELEAYRRAERVERMAAERAEMVYHKTNSALADATVMVDNAADQIGQMSDSIITQLQQLQEAVCSSKQVLRGAATVMYAIRPEVKDN